jgi:hypothetical protein
MNQIRSLVASLLTPSFAEPVKASAQGARTYHASPPPLWSKAYPWAVVVVQSAQRNNNSTRLTQEVFASCQPWTPEAKFSQSTVQ